MNHILQEQNTEKQTKRLAAQRQIYTDAKRMLTIQFVLAAPVAIGLSVLAIIYPAFAPYAALGGVVILFGNFFLEKRESNLKKKAALIQEKFDCDVLDLEWSRFLLKPTPDEETISEYAEKYKRKRKTNGEELQDWYTTTIEPLPVRWACILCQRINCWWNTKQHRYFANISLALAVFVLIALAFTGMWGQKPMDIFVLTFVAPSLPFFDLCLRLWRDHKECAEEYEDLRESIRRLWDIVLKNEKTDEFLKLESRMLQDQIFQRRYKNPLVFDWLYWLCRKRQQLQMDMSYGDMTKQALEQAAAAK